MVIELISLLFTMAALQIKCFSNSLTRDKLFNCPELLFLKGMTGALVPFSYLVNLILQNSSWTERLVSVGVHLDDVVVDGGDVHEGAEEGEEANCHRVKGKTVVRRKCCKKWIQLLFLLQMALFQGAMT